MVFEISFALSISCLLIGVFGHGRMIDPPQRSSLWRVYPGQGFEPNYNDNELFCGGFAVSFYIISNFPLTRLKKYYYWNKQAQIWTFH